MVSVTENYLIPFASNQTRCEEATSSVCNVQCKGYVLGHSFGFPPKKKPSSTYIHGFKESLSYSCKSYSQPPIRKRKSFPSDASLWVSANEILNIFQRGLVSPRMSPSVTLSFSSFFHGFNPERWN